MAYTLWGVTVPASLTHSTSLFLIPGCQLCDRANVTGSHSTSPGCEVGSSNVPSGNSAEVTNAPSALLICRISGMDSPLCGQATSRTDPENAGVSALATPTATPVIGPGQPDRTLAGVEEVP